MTHIIKGSPMVGASSRTTYDNCYLPDRVSESTSPLSYRLNKDYIYNCKRCLNTNGSAPRGGGFGNSTLFDVGTAPMIDLIDVDSVCKNLNVKNSKCKKGKYNPINLTTRKQTNYSTCDNAINPKYSHLSDPASTYRGVSINRFENLPKDPQMTIFWDGARNSRLESKDNFVVEIFEPWGYADLPRESKGKNTVCKTGCQNVYSVVNQ